MNYGKSIFELRILISCINIRVILIMSDNSEASLTSYKIVIIGDSGVGKTNMISRFTRNQFLYAQTSTIGMEFSAKVIEIDA